MNSKSLNIITCKIDELEKKYSRPGWTLWALFCTLGALLLLQSHEMELLNSYFTLVIYRSIGFYLLIDLLKTLILYYSSNKVQSYKKLSIGDSNYLFNNSRRSFFIAYGIRVGIISYFISSNPFYDLYNVLFKIFIVVNVLTILSVSILMIFRIPVVIKGEKKKPILSFIFIIIFTLPGLIIGYFLVSYQLHDIIDEIDIIRFSMVLSISVILIQNIIIQSKTPSIITNLEIIRNDLLFDIIDELEAERRVDILVNGLDLNSYFEVEINKIMRLLHSISYSFKEIKRRYNSIINDGKDYSNQQVEIVIDSISFRVDKASSEVDDLKKVITKYILRSSILKGQLNDPTAIEKLNQIIITGVKDMSLLIEEIRDKPAELKNFLKQIE